MSHLQASSLPGHRDSLVLNVVADASVIAQSRCVCPPHGISCMSCFENISRRKSFTKSRPPNEFFLQNTVQKAVTCLLMFQCFHEALSSSMDNETANVILNNVLSSFNLSCLSSSLPL